MLPGVYLLGNFWSLVFQIMQLQAGWQAVVILSIGIVFVSMVSGKWLLAFDMHRLMFSLCTFHLRKLISALRIKSGCRKKQMRWSIRQSFYFLKYSMLLVKYQRNYVRLSNITVA
uniref:Uncharacterized protein n=1 Tax=Salix viminalis TaxID=40686 RepID=A0A6N2N997_SALVM